VIPDHAVAVVGVGVTQFRARWKEKTYFELAFDAVAEALADAGIGHDRVSSVVYGIYNELFERQIMPDVYVHDYLGLRLIPSTRVTAGGATGGAAIRAGILEVLSGLHDVVLVVGVEKATDCFNYDIGAATPETLKAISYSADMSFENPLGFTAAASFAIPIVAHRDRFGTPTDEQMAKVSVKNHRNAKLNPIAQSPKDLSVEDVLGSRMICYPFKFYDNCLYSEGAAAIVLVSPRVAESFGDRVTWITGFGGATDTGLAGSRPRIDDFPSTKVATRRSYELAGITDPVKEFDLAELHDAFTGTELMSYEDCGLCEEGGAGRLIDEGVVEPDGELPVNVSGGLIGCGHAVGATALMQMGEVVHQLRGEAGPRQLEHARRGLIQSIGGPGCAWTYSFVLEASA
jgi:acetyl-CoA acetyltransferase